MHLMWYYPLVVDNEKSLSDKIGLPLLTGGDFSCLKQDVSIKGIRMNLKLKQ